MNFLRIILVLLGFLLGSSEVLAQGQTQCVSSAVAGGTGDAITVPLLPCLTTTNLLILTLTATNTITVPTLQILGSGLPAANILSSSGTPLAVGQLTAGNHNLLQFNGTSWFLLSQSLSQAEILSLLGFTPLNPSNNLSEITNAATARANLGVGNVASNSAVGSVFALDPATAGGAGPLVASPLLPTGTTPLWQFFGRAACNGRYLLTNDDPAPCLYTGLIGINDFDPSVVAFWTIGGICSAGDRVGFNLYLSGSNTPVTYTVQASDCAASSPLNSIASNLAGCLNGSGSNCTGAAAWVTAVSLYKDNGPAGVAKGTNPNASTTGASVFWDIPWGNSSGVSVVTANLSGGATETLTRVQSSAATAFRGYVATYQNAFDLGPQIGMGRLGLGRTPVSGDSLSLLGCQTTGSSASTHLDVYCSNLQSIRVGSAVANASVTATSGTTLTFVAVPAAVVNGQQVSDANQVCALTAGTTVTAHGATTVTISAPIVGAAPCPGVQSGDMISFIDPVAPKSTLAIGGGNRNWNAYLDSDGGTRFVNPTGDGLTCSDWIGAGNVLICGTLILRDTSAAFNVNLVPTSTSALTGNRTVTLDVGNGNRNVAIKSNLTFLSDPGAVTGAMKSNGSGTFGQAATTDLSDSGAWAAFTPVLSCGAGTLTSASATGKWKQFLGKSVGVQITATITTNGTCATSITATLPFTSNNDCQLAAMTNNSALAVNGRVAASATSVTLFKYDGTYPGASGDKVYAAGICESQ